MATIVQNENGMVVEARDSRGTYYYLADDLGTPTEGGWHEKVDAVAALNEQPGIGPTLEIDERGNRVTWCVCGQEPDGPWEAVKDGLSTREVSEAWLRLHFGEHPEYVAWYIDREANDGHAEAYWGVRGGELVRTN
jgi:hypothetical protein